MNDELIVPPHESEEPVAGEPVAAVISSERLQRLLGFLAINGVCACNLQWLDQALTHRSYANENPPLPHNERLEFLGDSVISLVVSKWLYLTNPTMTEGDMSRIRAAVVSRSSLGRRALEIGVGEVMRVGVSEERNGGRARDTIVGSALEAVAGVIYLSAGMDEAQLFVERNICAFGLPEVEMTEYIDYKSRLQELVQSRQRGLPQYEVVSENGPEHDKQFKVTVSVGGTLEGTGTGTRKRVAENAAARDAYHRLVNSE